MNQKQSIALITCKELPELTPDDRLLASALRKNGIEVVAKEWDSKDAKWQNYDACVLRSCWDYHRCQLEFVSWLTRLADTGVKLLNPIPLVLWNMHKKYLINFSLKGIPIIDTLWLDRGENLNLEALLRGTGWAEIVVKPAISATAYNTFRIHKRDFASILPKITMLNKEMDLLAQPFIEQIRFQGEWSFVFFGMDFSHAVIKIPAKEDFRTQPEYGSRIHRGDPPGTILSQAKRVIERTEGPLLYARVDGVVVDGEFKLMELEVIEPSLFFSHEPSAPDRTIRRLHQLLRD
ncbi:MAG TPA: hypothetical protein VI704_06705 [Bacteroidota bacterium]|nr:hypothetical protein [Bacteroidota bacterium]